MSNRRPVLRTVFGAAVCGAIAAAAAPALGGGAGEPGSTPGGGAPPDPSLICTVPTVEQCLDSAYMATTCGQAEMAAWTQAVNAHDPSLSACAGYAVSFDRSGELLWITEPATEPTEVLEPDQPGAAPAPIADKPVVVAGAIDVEGDHHYTADASVYASIEGWEDAAYRRHDLLGIYQQAYISLLRDTWAGNGEVASCREYVHEKYYDYQAFRDEVRRRGGSYRDYVDVAYAPGGRGGAPDYAIGTRALDGQPLAQKNGVPLAVQPNLSAELPVNDFFSLAPSGPNAPATIQLSAPVASLAPPEALLSCGGSLFGQLNVCDAELQQLLYDGSQIKVVRDWQWHADQSAEAAANGFLDEHLYAADELKNRFRDHLHDRFRAMSALEDYMESIGPEADDVESSLGISGELVNPVDPISALQQLGASQIGHSTGFVTYAAPNPLGDSEPLVVLPSIPAALTPVQKAEYLASFVAAADYWLEQDLLEARAMGCLDLDGPNPCNWSPHMFAQAMADIYLPYKEADYERCLANTGATSFDLIAGRSLSITNDGITTYAALPASGGVDACLLAPGGQLVFDPDYDGVVPLPRGAVNQWTTDTDTVDTYFQCLAAFKAMLLEEASKIADLQDECGNLTLGDSDAKYELMGSQDWGLEYAYGFGWELLDFATYADDPNHDECALSPEVYGYFSAGARAFGFPIAFVNASGHATTNASSPDLPGQVPPNLIQFQVLGIDVFEPIDTDLSNYGINLVADEIREDQDLFYIVVPFSIGPVPMSISGGLTGYIGLDYSVDLEVMGESCAEPGIKAMVGPKAGVEGFATVAVGVTGLVSAGVKIALQIIEIGMPFTAGLRIKLLAAEPEISFNLSLAAHLETLGGRFAIFLNLFTETWEWDLFRWEGLSWDFPLFDADLSLPIEPLAEAAASLESAVSDAAGCN